MQTLIDIIGYMALVVGVLSYIVTQQNKTRFILGSSFILWAIHYLLIGAMTTALTHMILLIRTWLSMFIESKYQKHALFWIVTVVLCMITGISWHGPSSLIPLIAALNSSFALCYLDNTKMRKAMFITSACWFMNGVIWGSIPQMISEFIKVLVNMYTIHILSKKLSMPLAIPVIQQVVIESTIDTENLTTIKETNIPLISK